MQSEHQSQFKIPYQHDIPFDVRHAVLEERLSLQQSEARRVGEIARKVELITREYKDSAKNLLGSDQYARFRAFIEEQKRCRAKYFLPPRGPEMSREEVERFRLERREESEHLLYEMGVAVDKLRDISRMATERFREFEPPPQFRDGKRVTVLLPSEVPKEVREHKTNPWTVVRPPFDGWAWWYYGFNSGFTFHPTLFLDAGIGFVGNINQIQDSDASDNDYSHMKYSTAVSIWYQMPTPGLVEVWIEGVVRGAHHHVSLFDEWGWSDSSVNQHDYLTLKATVGGSASELQLSEMSWWQESGYTEGYWDNHYLTDGTTYWAHLFSDGRIIFPAGSWVLVEVGMLNFNSSIANDVAVYSTMDFSWVIKSVSIHSTGR